MIIEKQLNVDEVPKGREMIVTTKALILIF